MRRVYRKKKKKKRDPAAPKHPLSAYIFFTTDFRERVKLEIGSDDVTKVARQLGLLWKDMDELARRPYQEKADADKMRLVLLLSVPRGIPLLRRRRAHAHTHTRTRTHAHSSPQSCAIGFANTRGSLSTFFRTMLRLARRVAAPVARGL